MKIVLFPLIFSFVMIYSLQAQTFKITGKLVDHDSQETLPGVYVTVKNAKDTTKMVMVVSDKTGSFVVPNLDTRNRYILSTSYLGYSYYALPVFSKTSVKDLGVILLSAQSQSIGEVVVKGDPPASVQKGDTTEMNAGAFKVNRDATAEDLIKKMPGVTSDGGTLKAHGEEVKKVLVDGKAFFGDDPSVALKNLPAEVIEKVQVFNKLSEQSEMTGFDDGNSTKTINIITKQNRRNGLFGKFVGGTDFQDKYLGGLSLNKFKNQQRLSVIGLANNINQQNFGSQDLISGSGGGGRNFMVSQQQGITTTTSAGLNYSNSWGKKANLTSSYFFNGSSNVLNQQKSIDYFYPADGDQFYNETSNANTRNANHRLNMRLELNPDTLNTIIITPRLSFQINHANSALYGRKTKVDSTFINSTLNNIYNRTSGNNLGGEIVYRHKFNKMRRTFSIGINGNSTLRNSTGIQWSNIIQDTAKTVAYNEDIEGRNNSYSLSSNLVYTEPIGKNGLVQLNYNASFTKNKSDKEVFGITDSLHMVLSGRIDSLTSIYQNNYITNRAGVAYRFKKQLMNFSVGLDYQRSDLDGTVDYPVKATVKKPFENILPNMMFMYRSSKQSNIRVMYRASTNAPSITQLQSVIDNSNSLNLSTGNPGLVQEYSHNLMSHVMFANPEKSRSFSLFLSGQLTKNPIGSQTLTSSDSVVLAILNVNLSPGIQLTRPVNLDQSWSVRSMVNYSFPIKPLLSKLNLILGWNYSVSPGYISSVLNTSKSSSLTSGFVLSSNISENVDFSLSYTLTHSVVKNDEASRNNTNYTYQTAGAKFNFVIGKGFVLSSDIVGQYNRGLTASYNQNYIIWNAGIGKKFLASKNAELKANIFDVLNQSQNISRTVTPQYIQDLRYNTLRQYVMLTFTYTMRNFEQGNKDQDPNRKDRPWMGDHPPVGDRPGGDRPPSGDRPPRPE